MRALVSLVSARPRNCGLRARLRALLAPDEPDTRRVRPCPRVAAARGDLGGYRYVGCTRRAVVHLAWSVGSVDVRIF